MFEYFNSMSTLRNIHICVNYKGKKHKQTEGEIFTTGEIRKNIQLIKRGLVSRYLYFKLYILMYLIFVFSPLI